jgi:2-oxoacid:acceptor oxidoreductase delta subunit (pyruvate/2-ketoisovalerate family)
VLALGQNVDTGVLERVPGIEFSRDGVVQVDARMMTGYEGVFAGGDMVPSERTITVAVGHGKKAARHIDAWLRGTAQEGGARPGLASFDLLNPWYYADAPRTMQPRLELARRESTFDEIVGGLDEETALFEARRCLSCGNCFSCDNCYGVCPDNAVIKLGAPGERYAIDYDFCKGCGLCAAECPCGAIEMVPEAI